VLQLFAQLLPLTHLVNGARAIMLDGAGLEQILPNLAALGAMSAVYLVLGAALFKWRQH
jgi:ABC-type multidrug transport system permease subunit